jgi:hypothetical protein
MLGSRPRTASLTQTVCVGKPDIEYGRVCDMESEQTAQTEDGQAMRAAAALVTQRAGVVRCIAPVVRHIAQLVVRCMRCIAQHTPPDREGCRGQTVKLMAAGDVVQVVTS